MSKAAAQNTTRFSKHITSACSPQGQANWGLKRTQGTPADPYRQFLRKDLFQRLKK